MDQARMRKVIRIIIVLNLAYCGVEMAVAASIGSVSLFADSVDFLEDAAVNFLVLAALAWSPARRARVGMLLATILLVPGLAALWTAWHKLRLPVAPAPVPFSLAGAGALLVNSACALLLARYRHGGGSLTRAAFISARNDVLANVAILVAGALTFATRSPWPDLAVGLGIAALNAGAAKEVWEAAMGEAKAGVGAAEREGGAD